MKICNKSKWPLEKGTPGSSGWDLRANVGLPRVVHAGVRWQIPTGIYCEITPGFEGQVRGRSGLRLNHGIVVPLGTIDADYRGQIHVILFNLGREDYVIRPGDKIAQLVFCPIYDGEVEFVRSLQDLTHTERGSRGYGSTGR